MPEKIKLAVVGIGNAASALIQSIEYYKDGLQTGGLLHPTMAGYHISDIEIVGAIDISEKKVGKKISEAIRENDLDVMADSFENGNIQVVMGSILDGVIKGLGAKIEKIVINDLSNHTFYAKIYLSSNGQIIEIDSRPSDAIALGAASNAPIYVADHVFDKTQT